MDKRMNPGQGKKAYKEKYIEIFEKNINIFRGYEYVYIGSLVLFRNLPRWKKVPDDMDVAVNRNGKTIDDLILFCNRIQRAAGVSDLKVKTVFEKKYVVRGVSHHLKKHETIDKRIDKELFEILLETGNIRISYKIDDIAVELFPEKNGNGLTNLGSMDKEVVFQKIKTNHETEIIMPFLSFLSIAQGYAMNFLKEIVWNNIYRFTDLHSKPKDGIRLFTIISLLEKEGEDASPKGVLAFIEKTVQLYEKIPQAKRSLYIEGAIQEFPWIKKMLQKIVKEYTSLIKKKDSNNYKFLNFYKKLGTYKKELNAYIGYLQEDVLSLLKKDILGEKYIITDVVESFSQKKDYHDKETLKKIAHNLKKITKGIKHIRIKNKNESFAYFYEMYMFKNLFIKPIKKIL